MQIVDRGTLRLSVNGRLVTVSGEAYHRGYGSPDFEAYENSIRTWDDGSAITEAEKQEIIRTIVEEAKRKGWKIEIV